MADRVSRPGWAVAVRALAGIVAVVVVLGIVVVSRAVLLAGHPAYPVLLVVVALVGLVLVLRSGRRARPGRLRAVGRGAGTLLLLALVAAVVWLRPYPADPVAVAATEPSGRVAVVHTATTWELRPAGPAADGDGVGFVFVPGALVDPRAYLPLLRPLAEQGVRVVVTAPPLGIALTDPGAVARAVGSAPEIRTWAVGGHSLGGVAASRALEVPGVRGLVLWASYPAADVSRAPVTALSVSGSRDALATPDAVADSWAQLPPGTRFVVVDGGVHAFFGDYGPQTGDGEPGTDRASAQARIVAETARFVTGLR
ncbi:alpha/beta hydrolase [Pseudonocardia sp. ICBG1293]|uniref:alpha/beta hydrolase n=1 Tax=Pseudonocardia sp. ICBG1293 TaxID=2844382 RepID=UPI001CCFC30C|nr:alpha/beta hydrolase [Pseudonocardia sp. ICBG1293]